MSAANGASTDWSGLYPFFTGYSEPQRMEIRVTDLHKSKINRINHRTKRTMLTLAVEMQDETAVNILLQHGARAGMRDGHGDSPMAVAVRVKNRCIMQQLMRAGVHLKVAEACALAEHATVIGSVSMLEFSLEHGGNIPMNIIMDRLRGDACALECAFIAAVYGATSSDVEDSGLAWIDITVMESFSRFDNLKMFEQSGPHFDTVRKEYVATKLHALALGAYIGMPVHKSRYCDREMLAHYAPLGRAMVDKRRGKVFRRQAAHICIALQSFDLPAPQMIAILDCALRVAPHTPWHKKWELVTLVKHFQR